MFKNGRYASVARLSEACPKIHGENNFENSFTRATPNFFKIREATTFKGCNFNSGYVATTSRPISLISKRLKHDTSSTLGYIFFLFFFYEASRIYIYICIHIRRGEVTSARHRVLFTECRKNIKRTSPEGCFPTRPWEIYEKRL